MAAGSSTASSSSPLLPTTFLDTIPSSVRDLRLDATLFERDTLLEYLVLPTPLSTLSTITVILRPERREGEDEDEPTKTDESKEATERLVQV
ncbi:hypothetical protein JCM10213_001076 [Rhodosporidiobolus nylandii]